MAAVELRKTAKNAQSITKSNFAGVIFIQSCYFEHISVIQLNINFDSHVNNNNESCTDKFKSHDRSCDAPLLYLQTTLPLKMYFQAQRTWLCRGSNGSS